MSKLSKALYSYASQVSIPSKDEGVTRFKMFNTQRYLFNEILSGVEQGLHSFVILKPRQVGCTTALAVLDSFWVQAFKGTQGLFASDSDSNAVFFRSIITELLKSAPKAFRYPILTNNRTQLLFAPPCNSRLTFQVANARSLGRGRGLNFFHGTEIAYWRDLESIGSLRAAFSETNPHALYLYESTANGYNGFYDMWKDAERASTIKAVFAPWWRHELYQVSADTQIYKVYWDGQLTADERAIQREITRRYHYELTPEQWAWRRYTLSEKMSQNELLLQQDFPSLPEHAFQASGQSFVGIAAQQRLREEVDHAPEPEAYSYSFGGFIEDTNVYETDPMLADLLVWEKPDRNAYYVIAADPAYGSSENSDMSVCQVWRATKTKLIQVAEFASNRATMQQFSWTIAHLCGSYSPNAFLILELNGPGAGVHQELERLRNYGLGTTRRAELEHFLQAVTNYLWSRPDSRSGVGNSYNWRTTAQTKPWILNRMRDYLLNGHVIPRSRALVDEVGNIRQSGDKFSTAGSGNDDRAITLALAVEYWSQFVMGILSSLPPTAEEVEELKQEVPLPVHQQMLRQFFNRLGVTQQ